MELQGYSAWITADGVELKQYGVETSLNGDAASCWIPSEAGKKFTIHWRDTRRMHQVSGLITIDGIYCGGNVISANAPTWTPVTVSKSSLPSSMMTEKAFMFAPLELTDDDSFLEHGGSTINLGEIVISIWRVTTGAQTSSYTVPIPEAQKVHEKSKKALAHRVGLGDDVFAPQRPSIAVRKIDPTPLARFTFKYRSLDMLKANGIAPAGAGLAPPASAGVKREAEDVKPEIINIEDDGEISALENRLHLLRSRRSAGGNSSKRVKREARATVSLVPGEVIDLTGD